MVHGDLKGVCLFLLLVSLCCLHEFTFKANVLIDQTGNPRLADFGLLTIVSDPKNRLSSSSNTNGGTIRWMSPELIAPGWFGLKKTRPTTSSDCYALGMVIYETISGRVPFHRHADLDVFMKVVDGERPARGAKFTENLWKMLQLCWNSRPDSRPTIGDVLLCLEVSSNSLETTSSASGGETEIGGDDSDSSDGVSTQSESSTTREARSPSSFHSFRARGAAPRKRWTKRLRELLKRSEHNDSDTIHYR